jgi:hypothetical protein
MVKFLIRRGLDPSQGMVWRDSLLNGKGSMGEEENSPLLRFCRRRFADGLADL